MVREVREANGVTSLIWLSLVALSKHTAHAATGQIFATANTELSVTIIGLKPAVNAFAIARLYSSNSSVDSTNSGNHSLLSEPQTQTSVAARKVLDQSPGPWLHGSASVCTVPDGHFGGRSHATPP